MRIVLASEGPQVQNVLMDVVEEEQGLTDNSGKEVRSSQKRIGSLQLEILEIIWDVEESTMRYITEVIAKRRPRSVNAIPAVIKHLTNKGLLSRTTDGKRSHYRATISREYFLSGVL